jgi:predicted transcriptional regulator
MSEPVELETQKKIYTLIAKEPGLHLNKIAELLNLDRPLVLYHLHSLEKHDLIVVERDEGFTRCYLRGEISIDDKKKLSMLRKQIPLQIVLFLLEHPSSRHKEILENLSIAKSTLSYHLENLVRNGIIGSRILGEEFGYSVIDQDEIIRILIKYKPSRIALGVKDTWTDFSIYKKKKKTE